ncbi:MAG: hypothetical protein A2V50_04245 [Bacteroidetes bacterium RBG_19FT_COMBO_42_10]|nr:MAG: hypothetical protein A2V50_04245 [Bacteroidetes bacterium RBG_19FT_COMBO_42_10]
MFTQQWAPISSASLSVSIFFSIAFFLAVSSGSSGLFQTPASAIRMLFFSASVLNALISSAGAPG